MVIHTLPLLVLVYAATLGAARLVDTTLERHARRLRESQLQAELSAARLSALRAQLHPHFLYNSLNGIAALIADGQRDAALAATEQLAELLHAAFRDDGRTLIPLEEELALVDRYLVLQQLRFADRLTVTRSVAPGLGHVLVPPLLLQPLVENAVQHGLAGATGGVAIRLAARTDGDRLQVEIENDGPRLRPDWDQAPPRGVGIPNTSSRLRTLYGDAAGLRLAPREAGGMLATVWLPLQIATSS
jgi:sensor histidine kinase YesM